jgi:aminoglycoside 3-N-acetyltransferase
LCRDLARLGLLPGVSILVHASLRRIQPDRGGPATVVSALLDVLGSNGTLVVPAQTTWNSTSSSHYRAATASLAPQEISAYRADLAAFDPLTTPSAGMGAFAEHVRTMPGALRSAHPQSSFSAVGALAHDLTTPHDLDCHLGERSPLGALYRRDGQVLHLGTGYHQSTAFHLAEYRYAPPVTRRYEARIRTAEPPAGRWIAFDDIHLDDRDFAALGADFEAGSGAVRRGRVGSAEAILYPVRAAVDHAVEWMRRERGQFRGDQIRVRGL